MGIIFKNHCFGWPFGANGALNFAHCDWVDQSWTNSDPTGRQQIWMDTERRQTPTTTTTTTTTTAWKFPALKLTQKSPFKQEWLDAEMFFWGSKRPILRGELLVSGSISAFQLPKEIYRWFGFRTVCLGKKIYLKTLESWSKLDLTACACFFFRREICRPYPITNSLPPENDWLENEMSFSSSKCCW